VIQLLGKDLAYYMKSLKKFSLKTVLQIGDQLVSQLEKIHMKGVLHRDLKPENILLGRDSEMNKAYLVDFGISKIYRDQSNRHMYEVSDNSESALSRTTNPLSALHDTHHWQLTRATN
jgi:serine/threonine protein kinase